MARGIQSINSGIPEDAVPLTASSGIVAAAAATATLTCPAGKTMFIGGFTLTGSGATAASVVSVTVTGVTGGTMTFAFAVPAGATAAISPLNITFPYAVPATGLNTNIVVSCPSLGTGNTNAAVVAYGYSR
jgi:hypothetical protein